MTLTAAQLQKLVEAVRRRSPEEPRCIGVHSTEPWDGESSVEVHGAQWHVIPARSTLEARRALTRANGRVLLLTPLAEHDLGTEVLARLAFQRLERIQPWQAVRDLFAARRLDPRVVKNAWMAETLIRLSPPEGYPPVATGALDLDTVWRALLGALGFETAQPGVVELLERSASGELQSRWNSAPEALREHAPARLAETAGATGAAAGMCLAEGHGDKLIAIGLLVHLLNQPRLADAPQETVAVRTRLERYGIHGEQWAELAPWGEAAVRWCQMASERSSDQLATVLDCADTLVTEVRAEGLVAASPVLRGALEHRLRAFAEAVLAVCRKPGDRSLHQAIEEAHRDLEEHELFRREPGRQAARDRALMALRLARWLAVEDQACESLAEDAAQYRDDSAWADRARYVVLAGEADPNLTPAYQALAERVLERREAFNRRFATRLARVTAGEEDAGAVLRIEEVLEKIVGPLAARVKVLLVVMDGMSHPVFQQLAEDLDRRGTLDRQVPGNAEIWPPVLTPLPSVTHVCRASLLSGRLTHGGQPVESDGFEDTAERLRWKRPAKRRLLFHKAALEDPHGGLTRELTQALESAASVVAVVVNAVDDQLGKGDQLRPVWNLKTVPLLESLVAQAEVERRAVVLVADHGHVVELGTREKTPSLHSAERWRPATVGPSDGEIEIRGPRVVLPELGGPVVVPWSEQLRYVARKAGYHGGATPQEVVAPLAVFVPANASGDLHDWRSEVIQPPPWWEGPHVEGVPERRRPPMRLPVAVPPRTKPAPEPGLFEAKGWIDRLLESPVYGSQKPMAGRTPPKDAEVRRILEALDAANGTLLLDALRAQVRVPHVRLRGQLTAVARVLNVDGFAVLEIDEASGTVTLDRSLIARQFELGEGAGP